MRHGRERTAGPRSGKRARRGSELFSCQRPILVPNYRDDPGPLEGEETDSEPYRVQYISNEPTTLYECRTIDFSPMLDSLLL
jgi:hypothetical protein